MVEKSTDKSMSAAQRAYEEKRAAKAGMSLDKWLDAKRRRDAEDAKAAAKPKAKPAKAPGFFSRLMEKAQKPL
jgi:hypothetical protein